MKRLAVSLSVWFAISGWAVPGHAKKKAAAAPAAQQEAAPAAAADDKAAAGSGDEKPAADDAGGAKEGAAAEAPEGDDTTKPEGGEETEPKVAKPTTLAWQDIVVVERKDFLKTGRLELVPFTGLSINDNLIRHYAFGLDLNYFLSDVFSVGLQGQYFIKDLSEREDLIGLQYNRIPTLNHYLYTAALNFGYAPVYGKFAFLNKSIVHWEIFASGGLGWIRTEIIPRDPSQLSWTNDLVALNVGLGSRIFLFDWLTVNFALRDYIFADRFEPPTRVAGTPLATVMADSSAHDSQFVNNVMAYVGIGMYLPTSFQYKAPR